MEYKIGSLADLISGNKTLNKTKVIQKAFTPVKKEPTESTEIDESKNEKLNKNKKTVPFKKDHKNLKKNNISRVAKDTTRSLKSRGTKRKADASSGDLIDSKQPVSKKQKLNEHNAASRIKNKINQEAKNSSDYKDRTLFVGNIPIKVEKKKIKKHFRKYGLIESVRIRGIPVPDLKTPKKVAAIKKEFHPDRNTMFVYIRFKNAEDAKKAEAENGVVFEDHHLRVHCCESVDRPDESKAIFVGNLPFNTEDEELWKLFKPCGLISHVRIVRDGRTAMGKGFGYVNFKDADSVQLALEMEKVMLKDRELRISVCDSSRAQKKNKSKKPRTKNRKPKSEKHENGSDNPPKKNKTLGLGNIKSEQFSGSKFDEKKKKKKLNKIVIKKKILAEKLTAK